MSTALLSELSQVSDLHLFLLSSLHPFLPPFSLLSFLSSFHSFLHTWNPRSGINVAKAMNVSKLKHPQKECHMPGLTVRGRALPPSTHCNGRMCHRIRKMQVQGGVKLLLTRTLKTAGPLLFRVTGQRVSTPFRSGADGHQERDVPASTQ